MSRLTKEIREQMARRLVAHRYADEAKELLHEGGRLFERVYDHLYPAKLQPHMEALRKAHPGAFLTNNTINCNAGGYRTTLGRMFHSRWVKVEQELPHKQPVKLMMYNGGYNITDETLAKEVQTYADRERSFDDRCLTAFKEAMAVLNTMTTGKKLGAAWPEAIAVIGDLIPEGERTLPVVQLDDVNKKFGLPPETKGKPIPTKA